MRLRKPKSTATAVLLASAGLVERPAAPRSGCCISGRELSASPASGSGSGVGSSAICDIACPGRRRRGLAPRDNAPDCWLYSDTNLNQREVEKCVTDVCKHSLDEARRNNRFSNYGCVGLYPNNKHNPLPYEKAPSGDLAVRGKCQCDNPAVNQFADIVFSAMAAIAQIACFIIMSAFKAVLDLGMAAFPQTGQVLSAGLEAATGAAKLYGYAYAESEDPAGAFQWWLSPCGGTDLVPDELKKAFDILNSVTESVSSWRAPSGLTKGSFKRGDALNPLNRKPLPAGEHPGPPGVKDVKKLDEKPKDAPKDDKKDGGKDRDKNKSEAKDKKDEGKDKDKKDDGKDKDIKNGKDKDKKDDGKDKDIKNGKDKDKKDDGKDKEKKDDKMKPADVKQKPDAEPKKNNGKDKAKDKDEHKDEHKDEDHDNGTDASVDDTQDQDAKEDTNDQSMDNDADQDADQEPQGEDADADADADADSQQADQPQEAPWDGVDPPAGESQKNDAGDSDSNSDSSTDDAPPAGPEDAVSAGENLFHGANDDDGEVQPDDPEADSGSVAEDAAAEDAAAEDAAAEDAASETDTRPAQTADEDKNAEPKDPQGRSEDDGP
ncbi:hypothetical protein UVI_02053170 [Ustilaginoidea virens]|uniref:Uncharacterized protein n=1 Tax=Ustilaginoidea virens TaxID=1159556 RepID=A0A1B5L5G4_USTVR|nr:hypothetical protein UVI_02053170 [Ustilaginoidea virens]